MHTVGISQTVEYCFLFANCALLSLTPLYMPLAQLICHGTSAFLIGVITLERTCKPEPSFFPSLAVRFVDAVWIGEHSYPKHARVNRVYMYCHLPPLQCCVNIMV